MDTPLSSVESLIEPVENYVRTTLELSKLKLLQTAAIVATSLISRIAVMLMILVFFLVVNLGIAFWLGDILGEVYYGLFVVAGLDLVVSILSYFFLYGWIKKPVSDIIIKQALKINRP
jgi:hypothetical protein